MRFAGQPIERVFEIEEEVQFFMDEGQNEKVVIRTYQTVAPMLGLGEEIYYIAHQPVTLLRRRPDCVVAQGLRTRIIVDNLLQFDCEATGLAWKRDDSIRT